jgi:4'-phosphopantetheinyl transferase
MSKSIDAAWLAPEKMPVLLPNEVHVWKVDLDSPMGEGSGDATFSAASSEVAGRDDLELRRRSTARMALNTILAAYLKVSRTSVHLSKNSFGKPILDGQHHREKIEFNVSHSNDVSLIAVSADSRLGIDIESVDMTFPVRSVLRHFSASGLFAVGDPAGATDVNSFFEFWTRNEAYAKATGLGFSGLLASQSGAASMSELDPGDWSITSFRPGGKFMGAIATSLATATIRFFNYATGPCFD